MIRALVSGDIADVIYNITGYKCDAIVIEGNDVFLANRHTIQTSQLEMQAHFRTQSEIDEKAKQLRSEWDRRFDELHKEYNQLYSQTLKCFNLVKEIRLRREMDEVVKQMDDYATTKEDLEREIERLSEPRYWYEPVTTECEVYRAKAVWHTSNKSRMIVERTGRDFDPADDPVNWSIIIALSNQQMNRRVEAVDGFVKDCQRNHREQVEIKVFLDTAREGRQFEYKQGDFETLCRI